MTRPINPLACQVILCGAQPSRAAPGAFGFPEMITPARRIAQVHLVTGRDLLGELHRE
jgi:hypothetical protein